MTALDRLPEHLLQGRNVSLLASAGTGKTTSLVHTVTTLFLVDRDLTPEEVLLLTFTEKAAAEMKERLVSLWYSLFFLTETEKPVEGPAVESIPHPLTERLKKLVFEDRASSSERLKEMIQFSGRLTISTIHSFCLTTLKEFPLEAGVDPQFEILDSTEQRFIFEEAFSRFLREEFERENPDPLWEFFLSLHGNLEKGIEALFELMNKAIMSDRDVLFLSVEEDPGKHEGFWEYVNRFSLPRIELLRKFIKESEPKDPEVSAWFEEMGDSLDELTRNLENRRLLEPEHYEPLRSLLKRISAGKTRKKSDFPLNGQESTLTFATLERVEKRTINCSFRELRDLTLMELEILQKASIGKKLEPFLREKMRRLAEIYDEEKGGKLDFLDLLVKTWRLLEENTDVRDEISGRIKHLFVDEFQDTDPIQTYICRLLTGGVDGKSANHGSLFIVGDPKQSIYRFRRADPQVYRAFHEEITKLEGAEERLTVNFRSRPQIVRFVNRLFEEIFDTESDYTFPYGSHLEPYRDEGSERNSPRIRVYSLAPEDDGTQFVVGLVERILSGMRLEDGDGTRKVQPGDIAILYRGDFGGKVVVPLKERFDEAKIPAVLTGLKGFFERQEVVDLVHVLEAIVDPENDFALYGALKSCAFGFTDTDLFNYFVKKEPPTEALSTALSLLKNWNDLMDVIPPHRLIEEVFEQTGLYFTALSQRDRERFFFTLEKFANVARSYWERTRGSTRDFLKALKKHASFGSDEGDIPYFEEAEDAVRVMPIHSAKGLEFPIVIYYAAGELRYRASHILYDRPRGIVSITGTSFASPSCWNLVTDKLTTKDGSREEKIPLILLEERKARWEALRLSYVAMTRAREHLFIVNHPPGPRGRTRIQGEDISRLVRFLDKGDRTPSTCPFTGCEGELVDFGDFSVFHGIPTFSPETTAKPVEPPKPIPELRVTDDEQSPSVEFRDVCSILSDEESRIFGSRVHQIFEISSPFERGFHEKALDLAYVFFDRSEDRARFEKLIRKVLESPLIREFSEWEIIGREVPLVALSGSFPVRDAADIILRKGNECVVIDYKTGEPEEGRVEEYADQVGRYVEIVRKALKIETIGIIWFVETGETRKVIR